MPSHTPRPTCEPLEPRTLLSSTPTPLRINAGGPALVDSLARPFSADSGFTGGAPLSTPYDVANTPDDALFSSYRTGPAFTFSRPVQSGHYALFLEFADPTSTAPAQRTFDVSTEGTPRLHDLDIAAEAGPRAALVKSLDVTVTDGQLDLAFTGNTGDAIVSAIVLLPTDIPAAAEPYVLAHGHYDDSTQVGQAANGALKVQSAAALRQLGMGFILYTSEHKGTLPTDLPSFAAEQYLPAELFAGPRTDTGLPRGEQSDLESIAWSAGLHDVIYLGAGRKITRIPASEPLAYENPDRVGGDQIVVLFADGHVDYLDRSAAATLIGFPDVPPSDPPPTQDPLARTVGVDPHVFDSQANLRAIGRTMLMYSNENRGLYPATPGVLIYYGGTYTNLSAQTFVNPRGTTTPPPTGLSLDAGAAWIDASHDYIYLGAGKKSSAPADTLLAFENPAEMTAGLNLLFADGHAEFREFRWALETIARAAATPRLPLPGDATRDGTVNFADLLTLARNFNATNVPFTRGDFNYDGTVNLADLLILARNYNTTVPRTPAAAAPLLLTGGVTESSDDAHRPTILKSPPPTPAKPKPKPTARIRR